MEVLESARVKEVPLFEYGAHRNHPETIPASLPFTFIDLFAGIGGLRLGAQKAGGRCVFTSEWDKYCQKTYTAWFGEVPHGDIRSIDPKNIPNHDLLVSVIASQAAQFSRRSAYKAKVGV